ncbi:MAG TPA: ATP-binding protein [Anaeromyxobacteraceae bacterium]|nr:ATP-binding protein [Anaeromyxobacteraceae bacterium]
MRGKRRERHDAAELRRAAEQRLGHEAPAAGAAPGSAQPDLVHELQVHQAELELQNEELRRARVELEEARDRYLELFELGPVAYVVLDPAGEIVNLNLAGAALLGVDGAAARRRPFDAFVAARDQPRWLAHVQRVKDGVAPQTCEVLLRPRGREPFEAQITAVHTSPAPDGARGVRCAVVDVTDRHRAEQERTRRIEELSELNQRLEQAQRQLLQADKLAAIGQLAAGVAHEINNPLTYVVSNLFLMDGYLESLLDPRRLRAADGGGPGTEGGPEREVDEVRQDLLRSLAEAKDGVDRVTQVVKDLVAFAHPDTGRWQTAELHAVIEGALRVLKSGVGGAMRIVKEYWPDPLRLRCRPSQLGQVFLNLLVNAAQAAAPVGTITIRTGRDGGDAWVEFEDTGTGIAPENMGRIFEPYFTTKEVGMGTGIGLSIAHAIVRSHGGRFEVRSVVGAGSTFRIVLPLGGGDDGGVPGSRP